MATPTLLKLPDELLLDIVKRLSTIPHELQRDLLALLSTCRRLRDIALDVFPNPLLHPVVHISKISALVRTYAEQPDLIPQVHGLEIFSATSDQQEREGMEADKPSNRMEKKCGSPKAYGQPLGKLLIDFCKSVIHSTIDKYEPAGVQKACRYKPAAAQEKYLQEAYETWKQELQTDYQPAFLAILLSMFPNLDSLGLSSSYLHHIQLAYCRGPDRYYLFSAFNNVLPRLTSLDFPVGWTWRGTQMTKANIADPMWGNEFRDLRKLRNITLPYRALRHERWQYTDFGGWLPNTIEVLRIVDIEFLGVDVVGVGGSCPNLRRIEVYFCTPYRPHMETVLAPWRANCKKVGREMYMWHPVGYGKENGAFRAIDARGQPWRYSAAELDRRERKAAEYTLRRRKERKELRKQQKVEDNRRAERYAEQHPTLTPRQARIAVEFNMDRPRETRPPGLSKMISDYGLPKEIVWEQRYGFP